MLKYANPTHFLALAARLIPWLGAARRACARRSGFI